MQVSVKFPWIATLFSASTLLSILWRIEKPFLVIEMSEAEAEAEERGKYIAADITFRVAKAAWFMQNANGYKRTGLSQWAAAAVVAVADDEGLGQA